MPSRSPLSRRSFLRSSVLTAAAAHLAARSLLAQAAPAPPTDRLTQMRTAAAGARITTQPLRGSVVALLGSGGNIVVIPGKEGKLLIDSGFSTSQPQIAAALAALSPDPLTHLIDTHWHFDHTDGNSWMHAAGATIIAHENTKQRLSTTQRIVAYDITIPPVPAGGLPTQTFAGDDTLSLNGETLHLSHFPPAHTDTDISVHLTNADVLHCGDTWFNGLYPFIDYSSGGNIDGMVRAAERNLSRSTATTVIVPGHGPIGTRSQLTQFHDMLTATREKVAALKRQGRSLNDVLAAKPTAPFDSTFKPATTIDAFVGLVYQGV